MVPEIPNYKENATDSVHITDNFENLENESSVM